jgi:hypothetical protein
MGLAFGVMFAGLSFSSPHLEPFSGAVPPNEAPAVPMWKQLADGVRDMKARGMSTGKNFAIVGACPRAVGWRRRAAAAAAAAVRGLAGCG